MVAEPLPGLGAAAVEARVVGGAAQRLGEVGDGLGELALAQVGDAALRAGGEVVGVVGERGGVGRDRRLLLVALDAVDEARRGRAPRGAPSRRPCSRAGG